METREKFEVGPEPVRMQVHESPLEMAAAESRRAEQKLADWRARLVHAGAADAELNRLDAAGEEFRTEVDAANEFLKDNAKGKPAFAGPDRGKLPEEVMPAETFPPEMQKRVELLSGFAEILEAADYPAASEEVDTRLEKIRALWRKGKRDAAERKLTGLMDELKRSHPGLFFESPRPEAEPPQNVAVAEALPDGVEKESRQEKMRNLLHRELDRLNPESKAKRKAHVLK